MLKFLDLCSLKEDEEEILRKLPQCSEINRIILTFVCQMVLV